MTNKEYAQIAFGSSLGAVIGMCWTILIGASAWWLLGAVIGGVTGFLLCDWRQSAHMFYTVFQEFRSSSLSQRILHHFNTSIHRTFSSLRHTALKGWVATKRGAKAALVALPFIMSIAFSAFLTGLTLCLFTPLTILSLEDIFVPGVLFFIVSFYLLLGVGTATDSPYCVLMHQKKTTSESKSASKTSLPSSEVEDFRLRWRHSDGTLYNKDVFIYQTGMVGFILFMPFISLFLGVGCLGDIVLVTIARLVCSKRIAALFGATFGHLAGSALYLSTDISLPLLFAIVVIGSTMVGIGSYWLHQKITSLEEQLA